MRKNKIIIFIVASLMTLSAISISEKIYINNQNKQTAERLKIKVSETFIDPDSVKFRNIKLVGYDSSTWGFITNIEIYGKNHTENLKQFILHKITSTNSIIPKSILCGEANAKNGFGAYTGYKNFTAWEDSKLIIFENTNYDEICKEKTDPFKPWPDILFE